MTDEEIDARFICLDCKVDTSAINEYYMVHDHVWLAVVNSKTTGMLCIGCLEKRLGRTLKFADFSPCLLNASNFHAGLSCASQRLLDRMIA